MYIQNSTLKRAFRILFLILCTVGITLQYANVARIGSVKMLSCYYTIHSNFVCLIYFACLLALVRDRENPTVKGAVVLCISVTGLVYHFMLNGAMEAGVGAVGNISFLDVAANSLVHYVVPIMTVADYLLFAPKGQMRWRDPLLWLLLPAAYIVFALVRAEVGSGMFAGFSGMSRYPYPFIDVDLYGAGKVALMLLAIMVGVIALGYLLFALDKLLGKLSDFKK